jgi:hypothetical protein
VSAAALTLFPVPAAGARGIERVQGHLTGKDGPDLTQGGDHLPAIPGLDRVKARDTVRDIFHLAPFHFRPGHLLKAERNAGDPEAVSPVSAKRHCPGSPDDREGPVRRDTVNHADNPVPVRNHLHIRLDCRFPSGFITGNDAGIQEFPARGIDGRADSEHFVPDHPCIKGCAKVIRELFADSVPVRFKERFVSFIIKPDRTRVHPHQHRNRDMFPLLRQNDSPYIRGEPGRLTLLE